ncbi:hypothetical protein PMAYCL1PPCAC_25399 [Pristionchus mayeri]|uniref:Membrane transporter n=1 Tax=Pristionchus mayeri TaxID=1317129 RepID=A0AAN5D2L4_9BILA|nr:hypothetical protein PMAYCL1PPCAC_25399 [Pristionchus mayeri]
MVIPANSRAAAVALSRLTSGIVATPSAQIICMISDTIRGDSTLPYDRFHAYQLGMLSTEVFLIISAICSLILVFFFTGDCEKAEEKEINDGEERPIDEDTFLVDKPKERSESILETYVRSRTTTVNSLQFM